MVVGGKKHQDFLPGHRNYYLERRHPTQVQKNVLMGPSVFIFSPGLLGAPLRRGYYIMLEKQQTQDLVSALVSSVLKPRFLNPQVYTVICGAQKGGSCN